MLMIFFFAITSLFGILHFVVDGKKWCYTHAFNIWVAVYGMVRRSFLLQDHPFVKWRSIIVNKNSCAYT